MYNNARRREKERRLWMSDNSSLSSSGSEGKKPAHKRYRGDVRTQLVAAPPLMVATAPYARTEYIHEETSEQSLINSQTRDGLATGYPREKNTSHTGRLPNPSHE